MAEYIEREAAIKAAEKAYGEWNLAMAAADGTREINKVYKMQELCKGVKSVFDSMPAADVEPVVHGTWVLNGADKCVNHWHCNKCGKKIDTYWAMYLNEIYTEPAPIRCPQCGAKMDGEAKP